MTNYSGVTRFLAVGILAVGILAVEILAGVEIVASGGAAYAEDSTVGPFWGRPYPYGYTYTYDQTDNFARPKCYVGKRRSSKWSPISRTY